MDTTTLDFNTLTLLVAILGSTLTMVTLMYRLFGRLDTKFDRLDTRVTGLETKVAALDTKVTGLDAKVTALDTKVEALAGDVADTRQRVARIEGHLMAPGSFTTRGLGPAAPDEPQPGGADSDPDHRQAG